MAPSKNETDSEEEEAFLYQGKGNVEAPLPYSDESKRRWRALWRPRLFMELAMGAAIVALLVLLQKPRYDDIRKSPVPHCAFISFICTSMLMMSQFPRKSTHSKTIQDI
jgi:hypothetical protein